MRMRNPNPYPWTPLLSQRIRNSLTLSIQRTFCSLIPLKIKGNRRKKRNSRRKYPNCPSFVTTLRLSSKTTKHKSSLSSQLLHRIDTSRPRSRLKNFKSSMKSAMESIQGSKSSEPSRRRLGLTIKKSGNGSGKRKRSVKKRLYAKRSGCLPMKQRRAKTSNTSVKDQTVLRCASQGRLALVMRCCLTKSCRLSCFQLEPFWQPTKCSTSLRSCVSLLMIWLSLSSTCLPRKALG